MAARKNLTEDLVAQGYAKLGLKYGLRSGLYSGPGDCPDHEERHERRRDEVDKAEQREMGEDESSRNRREQKVTAKNPVDEGDDREPEPEKAEEPEQHGAPTNQRGALHLVSVSRPSRPTIHSA